MKKAFIIIIAFMYCILSISCSCASVLANPDTNKDNPYSLTYGPRGFSFKQYTATYSIEAPSDGTVSVSLTNTCLSINRSVTCYIQANYWNGTAWKAATVIVPGQNSAQITVNGTASSYSFSVTGLPAGAPFYIRLSKSSYTGYAVSGSITVSD